MFRVGNCAGFSGDRVDAATPVVDTLIELGGPCAIFFEVLGERTVALAQLEKRRDPERGYEPMLERLLEPILVKCATHGIPIIGNFGAANPPGAAKVIARLARRLGLPDLRIGVVHGDDVRDRLDLKSHAVYEADTGLNMGGGEVVSANAYISAQPIVEALRNGAQVVKEQLLYEIHDPHHYITPDVILDFSDVTVTEIGKDRVEVAGMRGGPAPATIKATVCFDGGWLGEGEISYAGPNCRARARMAADVLLERLKIRKLDVQARVDLIGVASVHDGDDGDLWRKSHAEPQDIRVRLAVSARTQDDADQAAREALALYCCGPAGGGGVRWKTTPRIRTQSYLMRPEDLTPGSTVRTASEIAP